MKSAFIVALLLLLAASASWAEETFKDIPKDHWAAESIEKLASAGIVKGYPDGTYKGEKTVTRYELAVALQAFVQYVQQSREPIGKQPHAPSAKTEQSKADPGRDAAAFLVSGGFLPKDSKTLKDVTKPITTSELGDAFACVAKRLIELSVPEEQPASIQSPSSP